MNLKIMEAMEYMDEKYIGEALEAEKKASNRKVLKRCGAIAACLVLVVSLCLGFLGGKEEIVLPPTRYGKTQSSASLAKSYTLQEGVAEAEAVAWIRIGNWIGENTENHSIGRTYYEVEVVECYKGNLPETFTLKQYGSTKGTDKAFPLLTYGNELLLFLNKSGDTGFGECYYILGSYGTVMDVALDSDGTAYVNARIDHIFSNIAEATENYSRDSALMNELVTAVAEHDPIQSNYVVNSDFVVVLEDIEDILKGE